MNAHDDSYSSFLRQFKGLLWEWAHGTHGTWLWACLDTSNPLPPLLTGVVWGVIPLHLTSCPHVSQRRKLLFFCSPGVKAKHTDWHVCLTLPLSISRGYKEWGRSGDEEGTLIHEEDRSKRWTMKTLAKVQGRTEQLKRHKVEKVSILLCKWCEI